MLERCYQGIDADSGVERCMHMCCGYPGYLDQEDYLKADPNSYLQIASRIDESPVIDAVSIEDAHCHNDFSKLLPLFHNTKVILGVVKIASSKVETVEEIRSRAQEALRYIPPERLILAPDCGLGYLPEDILKQKLTNMCKAAATVKI